MKISVYKEGSFGSSGLPSIASIRRLVKRVLACEARKNQGDVSIVFTNDRHMQQRNKSFFHHDRTTDVMAFPFRSDPGSFISNPLGEIFISVPLARSHAKLYKVSIQNEICRLIIHGLLHLLGYSDSKPHEKEKMWIRQEELVRSLCLKERASSPLV